MAEAVVGVLIGKLSLVLAREAATYGASLLCKEASAVKGLFSEIRKANGELELMKAYLHDLEKFKDSNEITAIFVKKIRDLAFRIEDVVDEFTYKLEDDRHGSFATKMKKRIKHLKVWRRLAAELRDINAEIEDATKKRDRYAMPGIGRHTNGSNSHAPSSNQTTTSCFAREEDLVGIEGNAAKLKTWLLCDLEERNNKIATVWGMPGAGKTTLVDHVYKTVKVDFEIAAWVTVSTTYQVDDLLKKIAREFGIKFDARNMEMRNLVQVIHDYLKGKKYILILDDVWEMDVWINLMDVFPTNSTGRFVLTSRKYEIASLATSNHVIKLEPFDDYHSWKLFCNVAFRNNHDKKCPLELQELVAKFLEKCEGLPIAIACIGRLLCCKPLTYSAWKKVYEELELQSTKKMIPGIDTVLKVSLDDLSYELKSCFLHCAFFPEDYEIKRKRLIWHWITAGFIKEEENKTLERVADGYLNELINRSLLQVVKKKVFGQVKCCRMHDIIRHLALEKAEKECFGSVYNGTGMFNVGDTRRLSIQSNNIAQLSQSGSPHLRAIYSFTRFVGIDMLRPILASSKLLSTLDLQGTPIKILPSEIFTLFNLRYLGLRDTGIETLPKAIGRLQNLEVLDALDTDLLYLPKDLEKLRKLRFLYARRLLKNQASFTRYGGIEVPRGIRNLTRLQALQHLTASLETISDVAALTELRQFSITGVTTELSPKLCCTIRNMRELVNLSITASNESEALPLEELHLPETLYKLELKGKLEKKRISHILSSWPRLNNLAQLNLRFSKLDEDSFSSLMVLHGLCFLKVDKAYSGKGLYFSALSFPKLRRLDIWGAPQLNHVIIDEGALASLVELEFRYCPALRRLPYGIEYLMSLEELRLKDTAAELIENLRQESQSNVCSEELMKIMHIRKVFVKLTAKNIWERIR